MRYKYKLSKKLEQITEYLYQHRNADERIEQAHDLLKNIINDIKDELYIVKKQ